jgi:glyoxylase-like metal-dependent hydrolase (beta-lactamase superfamily II)
MRLTESIALVGSSRFGLSNPFDCSIYAIDCGDGVVLVDAGVGLEPELIEANMRNDGFDPALLKAVVITHTHADHAGGGRIARGAKSSSRRASVASSRARRTSARCLRPPSGPAFIRL